MSKLHTRLVVCLALALMAAPALWAEDGGDEAQDTEVTLDQVPAIVKAAALKAVDGLELLAVEQDIEDGLLVYGLVGTADGQTYVLVVDANGELLNVEVDNEEAGWADDEEDDEGDAEDADDEDEMAVEEDDGDEDEAAEEGDEGDDVDEAEDDVEEDDDDEEDGDETLAV